MSNKEYKASLEPFRHLWKTQDADWMDQRKATWKVLEKQVYQGTPRDEVATDREYFLTGAGRDYIPEPTRFTFTPLTTADQAREFFMSDIFDASGRTRLLEAYLDQSVIYAVADFYPAHVQLYADGVLGHTYQEIKEKRGPYVETTITPNPAAWCESFCDAGIQLLERKTTYHGVLSCLDYFISALAHATDTSYRDSIKIEALMLLAESWHEETNDNPAVTKFTRQLLDNKNQIERNWMLIAATD